jgi:hypothetical protein
MAAYRCDKCGFASFKTEQSFQGHLLTKKHLMRQENVRQDLYQCKTCNKWYCGRSGISHHTKTCSSKTNLNPNPIIILSEQPPGRVLNATPVCKDAPSVQEIVNEMKQAFEKERQEMKAQIAMLLDKHAGTTNNNNTTNNNIETQNINIIIKAFGNENTDYIDNKAILSCISKVYKSIPTLLEKIHFDPNHPENHNIKITNKKLPYASIMGNNQKWKTVDRKDAIEKMVINGYNMLDEKYSENKEKLPSSKQQNFEGFQSKFELEDKDMMKQIKTEVDMMVLNGVG